MSRPRSKEYILADEIGMTKRQVVRVGYDRLLSMKPEALALMVKLMSKPAKVAA